MPGLPIRTDLDPATLRRCARREHDAKAARRMLAMAHALEGMSRAEAARLSGMERQALRDAVTRYNAEGLSGLHDRPRPGPREKLSQGQQAALKAWILRGPDPERDGSSTYRLVDIAAHIEARYGVSYTISALSKLLRRMNLSWQKTRPKHPKAD